LLPFHSPPFLTKNSKFLPTARQANIEIPAFAEAASRRQAKQIQNSQIFMSFEIVSNFACPPNEFLAGGDFALRVLLASPLSIRFQTVDFRFHLPTWQATIENWKFAIWDEA